MNKGASVDLTTRAKNIKNSIGKYPQLMEEQYAKLDHFAKSGIYANRSKETLEMI